MESYRSLKFLYNSWWHNISQIAKKGQGRIKIVGYGTRFKMSRANGWWWAQQKPIDRPETHRRTIHSYRSSSQSWPLVRGKQYHPRPSRGCYGTFIPLCCRCKNSSLLAQRRYVTKREWMSSLMPQRTSKKRTPTGVYKRTPQKKKG